MSITTFTSSPASAALSATVSSRRRLWPAGVVSGAVASAATTLTAIAARAADIDLAIDGERIPLIGFAQLTMVGAVLGIVLAAVLSRRARSPRTTFLRTTVALTALSIVPDVVADTPVSSKLVLAATHLLAAAIIIPALAVRLSD